MKVLIHYFVSLLKCKDVKMTELLTETFKLFTMQKQQANSVELNLVADFKCIPSLMEAAPVQLQQVAPCRNKGVPFPDSSEEAGSADSYMKSPSF